MTYANSNINNAKYLIDSDFGLAFGEFEITSKNGKLKWHLLKNKLTGKEIPRSLSFKTYINESKFDGDKELFDDLYNYLSSLVHSGSRHVVSMIGLNDINFYLTNEHDDNVGAFVVMLTCFITAMITQTLLNFNGLSPISAWDISLFCKTNRIMMKDHIVAKDPVIQAIVAKMKRRASAFPEKIAPFKEVVEEGSA